MNDQLIRDLLHEVADDVEPEDRLDAIRAATAPTRGRTHRGWWVAGGAGLVAASVVTAFALGTGGAPQSQDPGPAEQSTSAPTPDGTDQAAPDESLDERTQKLEEMRRFADGVRAVYYIGDTPEGPRLYREFLTLDKDDTLSVAVAAALRTTTDGRPLPADDHDPDYRVVWPALTRASAEMSSTGDEIEVSMGGDPQSDLRSRGDLSPEEAQLAVEALVRTAQAAVGERLPVRFFVFGEPVDTLLGVATSGPVTAGPDLDVLAHVSLSDPFEGQVADNDEPFVVRGAASSTDGTVTTRIQRREGTFVIGQKVARLTDDATGLVPFTSTFDLSDAPTGDYDVISEVRTPTGTLTTDTRRITVID
jgi:hypothetical protein